MKKNKNSEGGLVYSTNKDLMNDHFAQLAHLASPESAELQKQNLIVRLETKHRAGKAVTVVLGFKGTEDEMNDLGKLLKTKCGTGGSVKNGEIIVQGDFRDKVCTLLNEKNYKAKRGN
jgi:translation initiation factor 1